MTAASFAPPCATPCATTTSCSWSRTSTIPGSWRRASWATPGADVAVYGPGEILPGREFYDYVAKYRSDESRTMAQADLDPGLAADIRAAAVEVYLAIGASGFARVDMLLSSDGILFISEINTIPGFTPISLFPRMTAQGGYDFAGTCEHIVALALEQAAARPARHVGATDLP